MPRRRRRRLLSLGYAAPLSRRHSPLEFTKGQRPLLLHVAERVKEAEGVLVRALPGVVVRRPPEPGVVRRARIRVKRHRIVRPDARIVHPRAPALHLLIV